MIIQLYCWEINRSFCNAVPLYCCPFISLIVITKCHSFLAQDLLAAMKSLGLSPTEQEVVDMQCEVEKKGRIFFPDFCKLCLRKFREFDEENFKQIMFKVSVCVYIKAGNESLRRFLSRGIEATFNTDSAEHLRHGPAPRQVQSQEVQDSGEVLRAVGLPADDVALARARPRHRDQGDVHVRRQGPGRQDILRRVSGGSTLEL